MGAKKEAEEKAKKEKAKKEASEKAQREAEAKAKKEAEAKAKKEAEEKANREAEIKNRKKAEEKDRQEEKEKADKAAKEEAKKEAEEKAKKEAEAKMEGAVEGRVTCDGVDIDWRQNVHNVTAILCTKKLGWTDLQVQFESQQLHVQATAPSGALSFKWQLAACIDPSQSRMELGLHYTMLVLRKMPGASWDTLLATSTAAPQASVPQVTPSPPEQQEQVPIKVLPAATSAKPGST